MQDAGELLVAELKRIGITRQEFIKHAQISSSFLNRRLYRDIDFSLSDIVVIGTAIESLGGDPETVWPQFRNVKETLKLDEKLLPKIKEGVQMRPTFGKPVYENSINEKSNKYIIIPGFEDCNLWLRSYDASLMPKFNPGQLFALKNVDPELIIPGALYYVVTGSFETFRKITEGKKPDACILTSINPDFPVLELFKRDIENLYMVKGTIQML